MQFLLCLVCLVLIAGNVAAAGQAPAPQALLDQLVADAQQYRNTIPSLTADETIHSAMSFRGMFPDKVVATSSFRALRSAPGEQIQESRQFLTINGKPFDPKKKMDTPYTLFGGFGGFQEMFFTPAHMRCFDFTLLPEPGPGGTVQIAIKAHAGIENDASCGIKAGGLTGLVRLDAETHHLVHLERTIPDEQTEHTNLAAFASVDMALTRVGEGTYWLPATVVGRSPKRAIRGECVATYTNYHRYAASMTLLPGATEVPPRGSTPP